MPAFKNRLFVNQRGQGPTRSGVYRICQNHLKKTLPENRLKDLNAAHCFRHSRSIHMLMCGSSISDIKNHLGHEDIGSTMIYLKLDLSRRREVQKTVYRIHENDFGKRSENRRTQYTENLAGTPRR